MSCFIQELWQNPLLFAYTALILVFSICFHEFCHAWTAVMLGDDTPLETGHLTLNPFRQMGLYSIFMLLFLGIAWGAVPINAGVLRKRSKYGELFVSLAGPQANFILLIIGLTGMVLVPILLTESQTENSPWFNLFLLCNLLFTQNFVLMIFNLLPLPGLDGWNVLRSLCPGFLLRNMQSEAFRGFTIFAFILFFLFGFHWLYRIAGIISFSVLRIVLE